MLGCFLDHATGTHRAALIAAVFLCGLLPSAARAQISVGLGIGVVGSSSLVHDSIVEAITVQPQAAPQISLRIAAPIGGRYRVAGDLTVSRSNLMARAEATTTKITSLTVWSPAIVLQAAATPWLAAEARLGAMIYDPSETESTLFSDGAPVTPALGLGITAERSLGSRLTGALQLRYDLHRFTTNALKARGFTGETVVHRLAVGITLYRRFGTAPTP